VTDDLILRPIEPEDVEAVQGVIESDAGYVERVTGLPPGPADAQSLLLMRPPDLAEDRKLVYGVWAAGELVGLLDVLRGWPAPDVAHVGLLQVRGDRQGEGLGRRAHSLLLDVVAGWPEVRTLRLAIVSTNASVAEPFWRSLGYAPAEAPKPYRYNNLAATSQIWTREAT
jgi:GNAT superfamily N-acetyltransferase